MSLVTKRQYVSYLINTYSNYTCSNLSEHTLGKDKVSHDAVSNFLKREKMTPNELWKLVRTRINNTSTGFLIVDDSVQDKRYSKFIELVKKQYSGKERGLVRGIGIVNLVHSSGSNNDFYPIDYRIYNNEVDGKTKNEHFREMFIKAVASKNLACRTLLFDSWYSSFENLKLIHRQDWTFFTTLKSNRLVSLSKEQGYIHLQEIEWTKEQLQNGITIKLKKIPFLVKLFKIVVTENNIEWVITNDLACSDVTKVKEQKDVGWQIEQFHREVKQLTGIEKCQCRSARAQRNHIACCYHAWLSLKVEAKKLETTIYQVHKNLFKPFLIKLMAKAEVEPIV